MDLLLLLLLLLMNNNQVGSARAELTTERIPPARRSEVAESEMNYLAESREARARAITEAARHSLDPRAIHSSDPTGDERMIEILLGRECCVCPVEHSHCQHDDDGNLIGPFNGPIPQQQKPTATNSFRQLACRRRRVGHFDPLVARTVTIFIHLLLSAPASKSNDSGERILLTILSFRPPPHLSWFCARNFEFRYPQRKIGSDLEHFEAIEKLANRLAGSSLNSPPSAGKLQDERNKRSSEVVKQQSGNGARSQQQSSQLLESPPPEAPKVSKMELYNYEEADEVFRDIDQLAMKVAKEDQQSFTDLVHHLTRNCLTDVEKVRAIFRWITVKNLNTMHFDSSVKADTPLGLLRGIKNGSESYHVLFKRLCR